MSRNPCSWLVREEHAGVTVYRHPSAPVWVEVDEEEGSVRIGYDRVEMEDYVSELLEEKGEAREVLDALEEVLSEVEECARRLAEEKSLVAERITWTINDIIDLAEEALEEEEE